MAFFPPDTIEVLLDRGALPATRHAVYLSGSLVRGWGHATSNVDVYVISDELPDVGVDELRPSNDHAHGPRWKRTFYVGGRRWDVEYWTDELVEALLQAVSWAVLEAGRSVGAELTQHELAFAQRVGFCQVVEGPDWVDRRRQEFTGSALRTMVAIQFLEALHRRTEDASGMLEARDFESATLVAHAAVGCAVDALLASRGEFTEQPKWRARRVRLVGGPDLTFDEYWDLETMRSFDTGAPQAYVERALRFCQRITDAVVL